MSGTLRIAGRAFAHRGSIDTDTMIKTKYCVSADPAELGPHCLEELDTPHPFVATGPYPIIVCQGTFGVGSARIQAPIALQGAGVRAVLATSFSAIFLENCLNGAYLLPFRVPLAELPETGTEVTVETGDDQVRVAWPGVVLNTPCNLPAWTLQGKSWLALIAEQAEAAGGLEALRRGGLSL